jgi:hypothetical protein
MTTFSTNIKALYTVQQPEPNYVVTVSWEVVGVDGSYRAVLENNTTFKSKDQIGPVVPYDQLTNEIVVSWIPDYEISGAQACVQGQINSMKTPPVAPTKEPLPWA